MKQSKDRGARAGLTGGCVQRNDGDKEQLSRENLASVVQTLNNLLPPLKIPEPRCSASSKSASYHTPPSFPEEASRKAL